MHHRSTVKATGTVRGLCAKCQAERLRPHGTVGLVTDAERQRQSAEKKGAKKRKDDGSYVSDSAPVNMSSTQLHWPVLCTSDSPKRARVIWR